MWLEKEKQTSEKLPEKIGGPRCKGQMEELMHTDF